MTPRKLILFFIAMLLTTSYVAASGLTISGVYYDPIQAESGGEAVQLENLGSNPVDLGAVTLVTKSSRYPLPATTLLPGQGYLVADTDWSTLRDNLSWPLADHEAPLSLANTDGFVTLEHDDGTAVTSLDTLAWNNTFKAKEGMMITHAGAATPSFRNMQSTSTDVALTITIQQAPPTILNVTLTDDAPDAGVQLLSFDRMLTVQGFIDDPNGDNVSVNVTFLGQTYTSNVTNNSWQVNVPFLRRAPGDYKLAVTASDGNATTQIDIVVHVLASSSITVSGNLTLSGKPGEVARASFNVLNSGNLVRSVTVQHVVLDLACDATQFTLDPDEETLVTCTLVIPRGPAGASQHTLRLLSQ